MIWIGIGAGVFLLDNRIKAWMEKNLKDNLVKEVAKDRILLRKYHNRGMALGAGEKYPKAVKGGTAVFWVILAAGYLRLLAGNYTYIYSYQAGRGAGSGRRCLQSGRSSAQGYVTDYFSFNVPWKKLRGLVFNLSDMFIAVGALLAAIGMCRRK